MKDDFFNEILDNPMSFMVSKWIIDRIPFVFHERPDEYLLWKEEISSILGIDGKSVVFTGSSCVGFSLNPSKNFRDFSPNSDIDIAIVSDFYFNVSWKYLRNMKTAYFDLTPRQKAAVEDHVTRLIYWGTIATDKILEILPFGREWSLKLLELGNKKPFENREINIRIYKDFESLRSYQQRNLENLRRTIIEK